MIDHRIATGPIRAGITREPHHVSRRVMRPQSLEQIDFFPPEPARPHRRHPVRVSTVIYAHVIEIIDEICSI